MKKQVLQILSFCLAVLLTVGLTSCGKKGTDKMLDVTAPDAGQAEEAEVTEEEEQPQAGLNPLTGLPGYDTEKYKDQKLIGVVVENHPGARPHCFSSTAAAVNLPGKRSKPTTARLPRSTAVTIPASFTATPPATRPSSTGSSFWVTPFVSALKNSSWI